MIWAVLGTLALSFEGVLLRAVGIDPISSIVWRGFFSALGYFTILAIFCKKNDYWRVPSWRQFGLAFFVGLSSFFFVNAILRISADKVYAVSGATPIIAALLSLYFYRFKPKKIFWIASLACFFGLIWIGLLSHGWTLMGAASAFGAAIGTACILLFLRNLTPTQVLVSLLIGISSFALVVWFVAPDIVPLNKDPLSLALLSALGFVFMPFSILAFQKASQVLSPNEVGMLMMLEIIFGPLLIGLFFGEIPSLYTGIGGLIVGGSSLMIFSDYQSKNS